MVTPTTADRAVAEEWLTELLAAGCEGVVAKHARGRYEPRRDRWVKVKQRHTIDAVVGGVRLSTDGAKLDAVLLGLYDSDGTLDFVGSCRNFRDDQRPGLLEKFRDLEAQSAFEGRTPDQDRTWGHHHGTWFAVRPIIVAEGSADQIAGAQFRHGARFERWRSDKPPRECTRDQLQIGSGKMKAPA